MAASLILDELDMTMINEMQLGHGLTMRGALVNDVREIHRHDHVPGSNTAYGLIMLEPEV